MICPEELVTLVTATAIGLAKGKSVDEIGVLSAVFVQLGDTLATIAVQKEIVEECCATANEKADNLADKQNKNS